MPLALPPEVEASYSAIIDSILAASDLNTISAKRIRKGLQEKVDYDISHQKVSCHLPSHAMARF
jgi:upstream activation factor subunit UAF30